MRNGAQGGRISLHDRLACFAAQWCKWPVGELYQLRIAKPEYRRLVEAGEHFRKGATVLPSSGGKELPDSRGVPKCCFLRSFAIRAAPFLQVAASLPEQPHPALVIGNGRNQHLGRKQERRCHDDE